MTSEIIKKRFDFFLLLIADLTNMVAEFYGSFSSFFDHLIAGIMQESPRAQVYRIKAGHKISAIPCLLNLGDSCIIPDLQSNDQKTKKSCYKIQQPNVC